jgi:type IV pilus assembly protein PilC
VGDRHRAYAAWWGLGKFIATPNGRRTKDQFLVRAPIFGNLIHKIALSRFCRTYATLIRSGVPILRTLEIVAAASNKVQIEDACEEIAKHVSQGGQVSEVLAANPFFPPMMKHMVKAGESTGNVDGMMNKIADFYDVECEATVAALTSLIEPMLIVFLGVVVGGIVMAMFLPIFQLGAVAGGLCNSARLTRRLTSRLPLGSVDAEFFPPCLPFSSSTISCPSTRCWRL